MKQVLWLLGLLSRLQSFGTKLLGSLRFLNVENDAVAKQQRRLITELQGYSKVLR